MFTRATLLVLPALSTACLSARTPPPNPAPAIAIERSGEFWDQPRDLDERDVFHGPWDLETAPDPNDIYVRRETHERRSDVIVVDSRGREWQVRQAAMSDRGADGLTDVALSRILSAVGYHQPPVYFVPSFRIADAAGSHLTHGGRFLLNAQTLRSLGEWSWRQNPFVGTRAYQGLLVILMMFNSSDLDNSNNAVYEVDTGRGVERWYVVRDFSPAPGQRGRVDGGAGIFEREPFITGVKQGFVQFERDGWHRELTRGRIRPSDVAWACALLNQLSDDDWMDAFRAGGFEEREAAPFIRALKGRIAQGQRLQIGVELFSLGGTLQITNVK